MDSLFKQDFIGTVTLDQSQYILPKEARIVTAVCTLGTISVHGREGIDIGTLSAGDYPVFITIAQIGSIRIVQTGEIQDYKSGDYFMSTNTYFDTGIGGFSHMIPADWDFVISSVYNATLDIYIGR